MHLGCEQHGVEFVGRSGQDLFLGVTGECLGEQVLTLGGVVPLRQVLGSVPLALGPLDKQTQGFVGFSSSSFSTTLSAP